MDDQRSPSPVLPVGSEILVRLVKHPRPEVSYPARVTADDGTHVVVRAPWAGPPSKDMGYTRFEAGDIFVEHYWRDRWFSIKEVHSPGGALKGWYCDVTRPATVVPGELLVHDLDLDLWRSADGRTVLRLDEDEFAASGIEEREPATAASARRALDELEELAHDGFRAVLGHNGAA
jgi:hypothetical protein